MKIYILLIVINVSVFGCKKNLVELNEDPNNKTYVDPTLLFKQALKDGAGSYNSDVNLEQWGIMNWVMYFAARGGIIPGQEYVIPSGKDAFWNEQYSNALSNIQQVINLYSDSIAYKNHVAAAKIWKVFLFHRITDLWGEIPYHEALHGFTDLNYMPTYNTQKEIYYDMLQTLKNEAENLNENASFYLPEADLIYRGNIIKWKAFANSLRLRLATRINKIDHEKYLEELIDLQNKTLISANEESCMFPFNIYRKNHVYESESSNQSIVQNNPSKFLVDLLVNTNDPRTSIVLDSSELSKVFFWFDVYKGVPNLLPNTDPVWDNFDDSWGDISPIGNWFLRDETPGVFLSFAEVCFLKAEAALNGYWQGSAQNFFEQGIRADISFYADFGAEEHFVPDSIINNYIDAVGIVNYEKIITQKWISFVFENGYEAYSEYRRTGYPVLQQFDESEINKNIFPKRLSYPTSEHSLNSEHVMEAISRQGTDNEFTNLWWNEM